MWNYNWILIFLGRTTRWDECLYYPTSGWVWSVTGSWYGITHISACIHDSNNIPMAICLCFRGRATWLDYSPQIFILMSGWVICQRWWHVTLELCNHACKLSFTLFHIHFRLQAAILISHLPWHWRVFTLVSSYFWTPKFGVSAGRSLIFYSNREILVTSSRKPPFWICVVVPQDIRHLRHLKILPELPYRSVNVKPHISEMVHTSDKAPASSNSNSNRGDNQRNDRRDHLTRFGGNRK